jgi:UDP-N-acetylglucosamine--N-acetylmuramyl-(pentapeptide) pyrophosphoryl-undecaprenol N-acetylglucosamine transferase
LTDSSTRNLPCIVLFNINGSGMGHMSTCLAYANRLRGRARPVFFSLASAIEMIHDLGYEADYFVSRFWSRATAWEWDRQLALRLGMLFDRVRPEVVVFDGTWPYRGLLHAAKTYGVPRIVWSDLTLYKKGMHAVPISKSNFDLVIHLGELGASFSVERQPMPARTVTVPPFTMLKDEELFDRDNARNALGLNREGRYALFSLGPGNKKDVSGIGHGLIKEMTERGYTVVWTRTPITLSDVPLPDGVIPIAVYPLLRYMRAFDVFVGAAGYNTCCEVLQSGLPALFVPNTLVNDDQTGRAEMISQAGPAVVSPCETPEQRAGAVEALLALLAGAKATYTAFNLDGAEHAANEILGLLRAGTARSNPAPRKRVPSLESGPALPKQD